MRFRKHTPELAGAAEVDAFLPEAVRDQRGVAWLPRDYYSPVKIETTIQNWVFAHQARLRADQDSRLEDFPDIGERAFPVIIKDQDEGIRRWRAAGLVSQAGVRAVILTGGFYVRDPTTFDDVYRQPLLTGNDESDLLDHWYSIRAGVVIDQDSFLRQNDGSDIASGLRALRAPRRRLYTGNELKIADPEKQRLERALSLRSDLGRISLRRLSISNTYKTDVVSVAHGYPLEPMAEVWLQKENPYQEVTGLERAYDDSDQGAGLESYTYVALKSLSPGEGEDHALAGAIMDFAMEQRQRERLLGRSVHRMGYLASSSNTKEYVPGSVSVDFYISTSYRSRYGLDYDPLYVIRRCDQAEMGDGIIFNPTRPDRSIEKLIAAGAMTSFRYGPAGHTYNYHDSWIVPPDQVTAALAELAPQ